MEEKWRSTPALRALALGVLKQLQGYQEEADALFRETQASSACVAMMRIYCPAHEGVKVQGDLVIVDPPRQAITTWNALELNWPLQSLSRWRLLNSWTFMIRTPKTY